MKIERDLLIRYFLGECTEKEREAIGQWLEDDKANKQLFINERIRFDALLLIDEETGSVSIPKRERVSFFLKVVSLILLLIGSSYFFKLYKSMQLDTGLQTIHTPAGSRTSLTLPDGSLVWLNSNTTLKYPNVFSTKQRFVELNGEAYFEIIEKEKQPFIVSTSTYQVEALGTTFNVEAYANKANFKTSLFTGKVRLYIESSKEQFQYLNLGETAELIEGKLHVSLDDASNYRWREGLIVIEGQSFEEIMLLFEKYFGQQIIINNSQVKDLGYHGKLRINDGVEHALRVLQNDFHFSYKRDRETNTIYIN